MVWRFTFEICVVEDNDNIWQIIMAKKVFISTGFHNQRGWGQIFLRSGLFLLWVGNVNVRARTVKPTKALKHTCGQTDPTTWTYQIKKSTVGPNAEGRMEKTATGTEWRHSVTQLQRTDNAGQSSEVRNLYIDFGRLGKSQQKGVITTFFYRTPVGALSTLVTNLLTDRLTPETWCDSGLWGWLLRASQAMVLLGG